MAILSKNWRKILTLTLTLTLTAAWALFFADGGTYLNQSMEQRQYSKEEVSYFKEIALQVEYGSGGQRVHKWRDEMKIKVIGKPTTGDIAALETTMDDLNALSENLHMRHAQEDEEANVEIYFIPHSEFSTKGYLEESVLRENWGLGVIWWNRFGEINRAVVLIATDQANSEERVHLIREELTQSLGLLNDSWEDPKSLFYQGWGTQYYTARDEKVVQLLYDPRIKPNMVELDVDRVLKTEASSLLVHWFHNKLQKQSLF